MKMNSPTVQQITESILGSVEWIDASSGYCQCPGLGLHTTRNAPRDCKVYLEPVPTLTCFHSNCRETVWFTSGHLRQILARAAPHLTSGQPNRRAQLLNFRRLEQ